MTNTDSLMRWLREGETIESLDAFEAFFSLGNVGAVVDFQHRGPLVNLLCLDDYEWVSSPFLDGTQDQLRRASALLTAIADWALTRVAVDPDPEGEDMPVWGTRFINRFSTESFVEFSRFMRFKGNGPDILLDPDGNLVLCVPEGWTDEECGKWARGRLQFFDDDSPIKVGGKPVKPGKRVPCPDRDGFVWVTLEKVRVARTKQ